MRNGQNKRMRGRNRKNHNPLSRVYESNGPDVKIRGTASHVAEKYIQLARDAQSSGDPVAAENYFQHAEHYFRLIAAAQEQFRQSTPFYRGEGGMDLQDDVGEDVDDDGAVQPGLGEQPSFGTRDPQPYLPRDAQFYSSRDQQGYPPRDQQNRDQQNRDQQTYQRDQQNRDQQTHQRDQQNRDQQTFGSRHSQAQPGPGAEDGAGLPSFITGPGPAQAAPSVPPTSHQGYGSNGFEGQGDRFPLHRRRRRHRGPRGDMAQGGQGAGDGGDLPPAPRPIGD
jgi:hypothetical protein